MSKADRIKKLKSARAVRRRERAIAQIALRQDADMEDRRAVASIMEDPARTAKRARKKMNPRCQVDEMHPMLGHPCGQVIARQAGSHEEAVALWAIFNDMDRADDSYVRNVLGRRRFAKTAKVEMIPERAEARADDRPDLRDEDQKHRDAANAQAGWRSRLDRLRPGDRKILRASMRGLCEVIREGQVTADGFRFMRAMKNLRATVDAESRAA